MSAPLFSQKKCLIEKQYLKETLIWELLKKIYDTPNLACSAIFLW